MKYFALSLKISTVIALFLFVSSCSKDVPLEPENEPENESSWTIDERFVYQDKTQLYSAKISDKLAMIGPYGYTTLHQSEQASPQEMNDIQRYAIYFRPSVSVKLPISDRYFVGASMQNSAILFINSDHPVSSGLTASLNIRNVDPDFIEMLSIHSHYGESMAINNQNQTLMAYRATSTNHSTVKLLLVDVDPGGEGPGIPTLLRIRSTKVIVLDDREHYGFDMIEAVDDHFLVSSQTKTLVVEKDGSYRSVLDRALLRVFKHNDKLYGFGRDGKFYQSSDKGNSWRSSFEVERFLSDVSFTHVEDQLVGYRYGQVWKFDFNDSGYEVEELVNTGLVGNLITSLNEFDGKVYVTTLSGVYYKPLEQFFEIKPKESK